VLNILSILKSKIASPFSNKKLSDLIKDLIFEILLEIEELTPVLTASIIKSLLFPNSLLINFFIKFPL
jgi:hypothetical protein